MLAFEGGVPARKAALPQIASLSSLPAQHGSSPSPCEVPGALVDIQ